MKQLYQVTIVVASTALGATSAWYVAHSHLSGRVAVLLTGTQGGNTDIFDLLIYAGMVAGVLMTLGVLGGLVAGVALARRVGKPSSPLKLKAA